MPGEPGKPLETRTASRQRSTGHSLTRLPFRMQSSSIDMRFAQCIMQNVGIISMYSNTFHGLSSM